MISACIASPAEVAGTIRNVLEVKGLTMREASQKLGLSPTAFSKIIRAIETQNTYPSRRNAVRLARLLSMNSEYIFHGYGAPLQNGDDPRSGQLFLRQSFVPESEAELRVTRFTYGKDNSVEISFPMEKLPALFSKVCFDKELDVHFWTSEDNMVHIKALFSKEKLQEINVVLFGD